MIGSGGRCSVGDFFLGFRAKGTELEAALALQQSPRQNGVAISPLAMG